MVFDNLKGLFILSNPTYEFGSRTNMNIDKKGLLKRYVPRLTCGVLSMSIGYFVFGKLLEFCQDRPIPEFCCPQYFTCSFKILCRSCCLYCIGTPTNSCMSKKIACRVGISFVKESNDVAALAALATTGGAWKDMTMMATPVLDLRDFFEEDIDQWGPFLQHPFLNKFSN